MRRSKFSDSQTVDAVKRVEAGLGVPDICLELGISTATFYKWRDKYGGMDMWSYNHDRPNMALGGFTPKQRLAMAA